MRIGQMVITWSVSDQLRAAGQLHHVAVWCAKLQSGGWQGLKRASRAAGGGAPEVLPGGACYKCRCCCVCCTWARKAGGCQPVVRVQRGTALHCWHSKRDPAITAAAQCARSPHQRSQLAQHALELVFGQLKGPAEGEGWRCPASATARQPGCLGSQRGAWKQSSFELGAGCGACLLAATFQSAPQCLHAGQKGQTP
jgi:hypothetical protein